MKTLDPDWPVFELTDDGYSRYELMREMLPNVDRDGREYEMVTQCLENDDFYQGLNMITVIRRKSDGKLFGYSWWDDISKYGESYIEENGYEYEEQELSENWANRFVFTPVEEYSIVAYRHVS